MVEFVVDNDVILKVLEISHATELFKLTDANRTYLMEWLPWLNGTKNIDNTKSFIEMTKKQYDSHHGFQNGIFYQGNLVGVIGFHEVNWSNRSTSMGYWLGEGFQGNGIMMKSCETLIEYAFGKWKLNRVEIRCAEKNFRSRSIPKRLGFNEEGIIREAEWLYDHFVDHVIYGVLAREWRKQY